MPRQSDRTMFSELFDNAPDAMVAVDVNGTIARVNAQAVALFGYAEDELRGAPVELLVPEGARDTHTRHRKRYVTSPRVRPMGAGQELIGLKRNGVEFPVEIALSPVHTPDGTLYIASIRDVSESQRARQALARARYDQFVTRLGALVSAAASLDAILEPAPAMVAEALVTPAVAIVTRNDPRRAARVRVAVGLPSSMHVTLLQIMANTPSGWFADANKPPIVIEDCARCDAPIDGTTLAEAGFNSAAAVALGDRQELVGALVALAPDVHAFDHDKIHFLQSVANMISAAVQRIRIMEQLSHAQRLEAVGQLTGGIAHDFNNLLTVISGNLQMLEAELPDLPAAQEMISGALRAVGRGSELTRKLLAFARRQRLSPSTFDPRILLHELQGMLKRTLGELITLEISCADDVPAVFADAAQLEGALVNLAINARDAMPRGGRLQISARGHVQVAGDSDPPAGRYVVFTVGDTGLGMLPEVLERAFEPFFTTKEAGKGSGLGLSMVYGFIKQSEGHLTVKSQLGYGTSIELYLPAAEGYVAEHATPASAPSVARDEQATVLVVEDEADVRNIAVAFLHSAGYRVLAVGDAQSALDMVDSVPTLSMVFSDMVLGAGMTGAELAAEIRRRRPALPLLLTSGYEHAATPAASDPVDDFPLLPKPYKREQLLDALRELRGKS